MSVFSSQFQLGWSWRCLRLKFCTHVLPVFILNLLGWPSFVVLLPTMLFEVWLSFCFLVFLFSSAPDALFFFLFCLSPSCFTLNVGGSGHIKVPVTTASTKGKKSNRWLLTEAQSVSREFNVLAYCRLEMNLVSFYDQQEGFYALCSNTELSKENSTRSNKNPIWWNSSRKCQILLLFLFNCFYQLIQHSTLVLCLDEVAKDVPSLLLLAARFILNWIQLKEGGR